MLFEREPWASLLVGLLFFMVIADVIAVLL
jgi:hypothetical protein